MTARDPFRATMQRLGRAMAGGLPTEAELIHYVDQLEAFAKQEDDTYAVLVAIWLHCLRQVRAARDSDDVGAVLAWWSTAQKYGRHVFGH